MNMTREESCCLEEERSKVEKRKRKKDIVARNLNLTNK